MKRGVGVGERTETMEDQVVLVVPGKSCRCARAAHRADRRAANRSVSQLSATAGRPGEWPVDGDWDWWPAAGTAAVAPR